jgi:hypothetical protein
MVTRGVYLETTGGMDTSHVIDAISWFVHVRGVPATLTSANQTSFQKADKEITEWYKSVNWDIVQEETGLGFWPESDALNGTSNASHFGGIFEIIIKARAQEGDENRHRQSRSPSRRFPDLCLKGHVHAEQATDPTVWQNSGPSTTHAK